jgi:Family of unknown function (DUF5677)
VTVKSMTHQRALEDVPAVIKFIHLLERYVNEMEVRPRQGYAADWVLLALVSKSLWVAKAVCNLVRSGFSEEAFGLTRTLTDIFFTVRFICNQDSERRARRFGEFFAKEQEVALRIKNVHFPKTRLRARPDQARLTAMAKQFGHSYRWSGHDTRYLAQEPDTIETDAAGNPATQIFDYEVIYSRTSSFVHPTVAAIDSHIGSKRAPFRVATLERATLGEDDMALFNTVLFLSKIFIYVFRHLGSGLPGQLGNKTKVLMERLVASGQRHRRTRRARQREKPEEE